MSSVVIHFQVLSKVPIPNLVPMKMSLVGVLEASILLKIRINRTQTTTEIDSRFRNLNSIHNFSRKYLLAHFKNNVTNDCSLKQTNAT